MMARVLAFCMNAQEYLSFTKGLSSVEEPDIWVHTLDDRISLWIDIGEPTFDRMKKATRLSPTVKVYSFNLKSDSWWAKEQAKFNDLKISVFQFHWKSVQTLAELVKRTMNLSITISDGLAYVSAENGECEVPWVALQSWPAMSENFWYHRLCYRENRYPGLPEQFNSRSKFKKVPT
ncbi:MAG: YaeQ family protein [Proteobacteria bacterium]|nr:YaeQ family protein [Pseudomonadota bacterium]